MITGKIDKLEDCEKDKSVAMKNTIDKMANDNGEIKAGILLTFHEKTFEPRMVGFGLSPTEMAKMLQMATFGMMSAVENFEKQKAKEKAFSDESHFTERN